MKNLLTNTWHEVLRLDHGERVAEGLLKFLKDKGIETAWFWGIGAAKDVELAFYDRKEKKYLNKVFKEELEITALSGNVAMLDGKPVFHMHGSFGRKNFETISGHVNDFVVHNTTEIFIHKIEGSLKRKKDPESGLNLLD